MKDLQASLYRVVHDYCVSSRALLAQQVAVPKNNAVEAAEAAVAAATARTLAQPLDDAGRCSEKSRSEVEPVERDELDNLFFVSIFAFFA